MEPAATKESISLVVSLLKEAEKQGLIDRLRTVFKKKPRILLLGCTGTGKSNLRESLVKPNPPAINAGDRTMYTEAKNIIVQGKPYRFIDTPGDEERSDDRKEAMRQAMAARGGIAGIINVVCYGYHEYAVSRHHLFTSIPPQVGLIHDRY